MSSSDIPALPLDVRARARMSWDAQLRRHATRIGDRSCLRFGEWELSYAEFDARVDRVAGALAAGGVGVGDRVALLMGNRLEVSEAMFGALRLGAIAVPINSRLAPGEVRWIVENCAPAAIVTDVEYVAALDPARGGLRLIVGSGGADDYETALAQAGSPPLIDVPEDTPAFLMYTSGTTGRPKGAILTHFSTLMNSLNSLQVQGAQGDDEVWYAGPPLFHIGGLSGLLSYLYLGGLTILGRTGQFDAAATIDIWEAAGVTGSFLVPTQWQALCDLPDLDRRRLRLRRLIWGGSPAPRATLEAMARSFPGVPNFCAFGQTEMSPNTAMLQGKDAIEHMGSVGRPMPNVELRIVRPDNSDVATGEVGELVYRAPTMLRGYWRNPEATAEAMAGGWFHSGDLGRYDEDGFIYVVDRVKDMIISGGENIYCPEIESVLVDHPKVRDVAVIGVPHPKWVETPKAIVVPVDPADPPTLEDIVGHCLERLASFKKPTVIEIVEELPRNAGGKVLKPLLRQRYGRSG